MFGKKDARAVKERVRDEQKRCANCSRLLSEYSKKEICHSCDEQGAS